jgi:S-adenosylmethionine:tRNA ribosyltransferase-isomerase
MVLRLTLLRQQDGHWLARPEPTRPAFELLERYGHVPLPPYIRKGHARDDDRYRYQTVYARQAGAVAAPTAGLHFTPEVFARLDERGVKRAFVTLHVGIGTFQPIKTDDVAQHQMHREWGELPDATADAIADCKSRGHRVVAVGTTAVRVLETAEGRPWCGETELFIYPPYAFRCVDALVTNFHLPRSTLLLLVAAFAGVELTRRAYRVAVEQGYRFFSYGDAMLLL